MGFPDNVLARDERVERSLHPHWLTVVAPTLLGVVLLAGVVGVVLVTPDDDTGNLIQWIALGVAVLVGLFAVVVPYLRWRTTHYVITSHRVMVRRGLLTKTGKDITLSKITDVSFEQTLFDRMINAGSLHIESAGDSPDEDLRNIPQSNHVQQLINRLIDEDDLRRRRVSYDRPDDVDEEPYADDPADRPDRPELAEERRRRRRDDPRR
ncbi:MAG: PH domain-containing protein [Terracoccus sp.]